MRPDETPQSWIPAYPDETLEDLQRGGLRMLQKKSGFRFGTDSVLLAAYGASFYPAGSCKKILIADLGAGCGAVSLLLAARLPNAGFASIELDKDCVDLLQRNGRLNRLEGRMRAIHGDIRSLAAGATMDGIFKSGSFDMVISNPPYRIKRIRTQDDGTVLAPQDMACEETSLCFRDLALAARRLLKARGRLVLVHQAGRLPEIIKILCECGLEPKTLRFVQPSPDRAPSVFLMSAVSQGKPGGFRVEKPLVIFDRPGEYNQETAAIYGFEDPLDETDLQQGVEWVSGRVENTDTELK
jgi:tRNA1Val (adenine37-N6)-methyltransferase